MTIQSLNSRIFYDTFVAATTYFERHIDAINDLNVFPVPDGDTGTNMYQTLSGIKNRVSYEDTYSVQQLSKLLSDAALWEGRGNSGIILSQIFKGIHLGLQDKDLTTVNIVSSSLECAFNSAYASITNPTEGTILTVLRDIAEESGRQIRTERTFSELLAALSIKAKESVDSTPNHLELLRDAGVVDSGAYGLEIFLRGIHLHLSGLDVENVDIELRIPAKDGEGVQNLIKNHHDTEEIYGYCTQFILKSSVGIEDLRELFVDLGLSLVVAGDSGIYRIHIHTETPGDSINVATTIGSISEVSIEDMEKQSVAIMDAGRKEKGESKNQNTVEACAHIGFVAVATGSGIKQIFRENGALAIISGGDSMNPSVAEIAEVLDSIKCESIFLLPNNKNIVSTAKQAADLSKNSVVVIPTNSIAEGLECSAEFDPNSTAELNEEILTEVMTNVRTLLIFKAERTARIGDVDFQKGYYGALLDESPLPFKGTASEILSESLKFSGAYGCDQITILLGENVTEYERIDLEGLLLDQFGDFYHDSIQIIEGKQPNYEFIVALLSS